MIITPRIFTALMCVLAIQERVEDHLAISADERKALIALYEKTGGKNWPQQYRWLGPNGTECSWYGVKCGREISRQGYRPYTVMELDLSNNALKGEVPTEVGALRNLKSLMLDGNAIKGPLPDSVLQMFDRAQLEISPLSLIHDVEEILVEVDNPALLCGGFRAWISANGNVRRERKMCREKGGGLTAVVYFEYQQGKSSDFYYLARSLVRKGFFSDTPLSIRAGPWWTDVKEISVTARRIGGATTVRSWKKPKSVTEWELEMQIYGILEDVLWDGPPTTKRTR